MGFTFDNITSKDIKIKARLLNYSVVPSIRNKSQQISGKDGLVDFGCELSERNIVFDCYIFPQISKGKLIEIADNLATTLDPKLGTKKLILDDMPQRYFHARLTEGISVEKLIQNSGAFSLTFMAFDPYGYAIVDEEYQLSATGESIVTRAKGNADSFPVYEVVASIPSSTDTLTITTNEVELKIKGGLLASETLIIDSALMTAKVVDENGVTIRNGLTHLDAFNFPTLKNGENTINISETGSVFTSLKIKANSRWR